MYLSSVLVVEVNSLFADHRMTEQSLRVFATLECGRHIEFLNLNPGLPQMSSSTCKNMAAAKRKADQPPLGEDWLLNNDFFLIMFFFFQKA